MSTIEKRVFSGFLKLPKQSRIALLKKMMDTVEDTDRQIQKAWIEEAERRLKAVDSEEEELLPGPETVEKLRRKYRP